MRTMNSKHLDEIQISKIYTINQILLLFKQKIRYFVVKITRFFACAITKRSKNPGDAYGLTFKQAFTKH